MIVIGIVLYLTALLMGVIYALGAMTLGWLPQPYEVLRIPLMCAMLGGGGGCLYCLRAVYLNKCVHNRWASHWNAWYFIRPITSFASGGISYLFLKAGLLILESDARHNASEMGFFALAFIAGLNVDKFMAKIEDVAQAVWGIERSRASKDQSNTQSKIDGP
ncbi:hypothetical protein ACMHYO_07015 [Allopusillimonas ginsengisoli]|uniref:hypothetical protein n=1 Tax=Alcaligenaceae TaxID=506 RepID=UPI0007C4AE59|nr:hypothetical protein [Alcaligenes faecalis]ARP52323.1 hypothetical protein ALFP_0436 [Alcaligenes faecalis]